MARMTISACIVTFNEEENIRACLGSVKWADEIVVVDSFSTDRTVEIAQEFTEHVLQREWPGHIAQKKFALEDATGEWILCIDADEQVSSGLAAEIQAILQDRECAEVAFAMPRKTWYLGRWITHGGWYPNRKLRLFRKGRAEVGGVEPHDHIHADGPVGTLKGDLYHFTYRDVAEHLETISTFTTVAANEMHARGRGHALFHMLTNAPARFLKMYLLRLGFLDGLPGFVLAVLSSYYVFLKYTKLWELQHAKKRGP